MAAGGDLNGSGGAQDRPTAPAIKPSDLLLALLANIAWAFNFIAGKAGVAHFQPFLFTALRFAILLLALLPFLRWIPHQMRSVLGIALVQGVLHFSLVFAGLEASGDIVFPIDIRTLNIKPILELPHIAYQEDEKTTGLFRFFPSKT